MTSMQNPPRPQPLTFSHVQRQEETWSSDSDSGITVDSQSPPSKTTPDSGIGVEQPSWNRYPPQPPSLLSDDGLSGSMSGRAGTSRAGVSTEASEAERQRQQEYVRSTLLEYERQKRLEEEEEDGGGQCGSRDCLDPECSQGSSTHTFPPPHHQVVDVHHHHSGGCQQNDPAASPNSANDYVPCQMARKLLLPDREQGDVSEGPPHVTYHDLSERFSSGELFPPGDDGYGTDSHSNTTTGSLASPLSSSLSSLTTDSSCSLNGSQRGVGSLGGSGSVRVQPVAGGGRLVIGKRGMLVKRRDLPPVERTDTVTLEDRLRALTTIQEEDSAAASATASKQAPSLGNQRKEGTRTKADSQARSDPAVQDSGSRSGSAGSRDGETYPEGLYSVITKRPNQLPVAGSSRPASRPRAEGCGDGDDFSSASLHRAVPVKLQPQGDPHSTQRRRHSGDLAGHSAGDGDKRNSSDCGTTSGKDEVRGEVRFKAGGGGVKLNESGQFEIDYSYYMKASPSDSNDEINTYSPTSMHNQFSEAFREGDSMPPPRRSTPRFQKTDIQPEDSTHPSWSEFSVCSDKDLPGEADAEAQGCFLRSVPSHRHDLNYSDETEHVYMNVGPYDGRPVPGSMPNLSLHPAPQHSRRHSGDLVHHPEPQRHGEDGGSPQSVLRRNPTPGSGYTSSSSSRLATQGDRNSCDVGSLYRQTDLSLTFPPPSQGQAADRLSLNLADLPRIHEQLRATSEMLLTSGKRHQFASSSDIYRLFQGQQGQGGGFAQGRHPPHRRSFHDLNPSPTLHSLAEVRSRVKANTSPSGSARSGADQSPTATSPAFSPRLSSAPKPLQANHNISVPETFAHSRYGNGRDHVSIRASRHVHGHDASAAPPGRGRDGGTLKERLDRGQQFATDVIRSEEGEQLSTLV